MGFGLHDKDWIDPPDEPDPPQWYEEYVWACEEIGCNPKDIGWDDHGHIAAIDDLENIKAATEKALEVI